MSRFVCVSVGTYGSTFPLVTLGSALRARGHHVTLLAHHEFESSACDAGLEFAPICDTAISKRALADYELQDPGECTPVQFYLNLAEYFGRYFQPLNRTIYRQLLPHIGRGACVIADDHHLLMADLMAKSALGAKVVRVFPEPVNERGKAMLLDEEFLQLAAARFGELCVQLVDNLDLPARCLDVMEVWGTPEYYAKVGVDHMAAWPDWYAPAPTASACFQSGFLCAPGATQYPLPTNIRNALRDKPSPILFVAGTMGTTDEWEARFFDVSVSASRRLGRRALLLSGQRGRLPGGSWPDALRIDFLPIAQVASSLPAVVHHGGMNGAASILAAGTPQILVPRVFGQPENSRRFEQLGVASVLEPNDYREERVTALLREILSSTAIADQCRRFAQRLHSDCGIDTACSWLESHMSTPMTVASDVQVSNSEASTV